MRLHVRAVREHVVQLRDHVGHAADDDRRALRDVHEFEVLARAAGLEVPLRVYVRHEPGPGRPPVLGRPISEFSFYRVKLQEWIA